jgi:hypothetical protein
MSDVTKKTFGQLVDELITTSMRTWFAQEDIMDESLSTEKRLGAAVRAQTQNAKRTELIRAIDAYCSNEEFSNVSKTYHTYFKGD